jgi:uncharacterized protein (TIRG00374 family)
MGNLLSKGRAHLVWGKRILPFVLTLLIVGGLLSQISVRDVVGLLSSISYRWVLVGLACYLVTNVFRAFRLQVLLPDQTTQLLNLLSISVAQSMFNNILPARLGELSLVYLLNKYEAIPLDRATVALIVARVFDYLAVAAIFVVAAMVSVRNLPQNAANFIFAAITVMLLSVVILLSAAWWGRGLVLVQWLLGRLGVVRHRLVVSGLQKMHQVVEAFELVTSPIRYLLVFGWSLFVWCGTFAWFYAFLRSMHIQVVVDSLVVGSTFAVLSKAVPFISVGGLGAHEAGWTVGFMLVGFDKTTAISSGFAVNILTLLSSLALGPWGLWILTRMRLGSSPGLAQAGTVEEDTR